ncbi:MAG: hypothetical protein Q9167_006855 [Letrouitia subvulpina]
MIKPGSDVLVPLSLPPVEDPLWLVAFERMMNTVFDHTFIPWKFHPRSAVFEPDPDDSAPVIDTIVIEEVSYIEGVVGTSKELLEAYSIYISDNAEVTIKITHLHGWLHALETFSQLFCAHSKDLQRAYTPFASVIISDGPSFEHRGLNLDISRNWIPPEDVKRTISAMAACKLNRLHLHAADAQSWPLEIPSLPKLADKGAYSSFQTWSAADLENVQQHGKMRGIEVYLEIDMPGHTTAIGRAFPELITAANEEDWSKYAFQPPSGQLRLNSTNVTAFVSTVLGDLLLRTSRFGHLFHFGGDELNLKAYELDPNVKSSSVHVIRPLLQSFVDHELSIAAARSITPIVWEDMLLDWNLTLPLSTIVQTWRPTDALTAVLAKGHRALFGSNRHWYLDCGLGFHVDPDPSNPHSPIKPPFLDSCSPYKNWREIYSYVPLDGIEDSLRHLILGGELHLWSELTDSITLDGMLWPRVAAAAEVMWSGGGKVLDEETTRRLAEMRERLVARGIRAGMVQMEFCLRNKGSCKL